MITRGSLLLPLLLCSLADLHAQTLTQTRTCADLQHHVIPATDIALPTRGGLVDSARHVHGPGGGYCRVLGRIGSIDPAADPIRFEVNLPETWNGKALQFGGGAFNGYLKQSDGRSNTVVAEMGQPTPLDRGYTTFGSDSGHHKHYRLLPDIFNLLNPDFGLNDEERNNFASDGLKKTHDVALHLMQARYNAAPKRMYFIGGSTGGREAMKVVDRWPSDYDGVLAAYAAWNQIESDLQFIRVSQATYAKGKDGQSGWLPSSKTKLLRDAVLRACDAQDGLTDRIVSNPAGCSFHASALRCSDGLDHKACLSDGQERTVAAFSSPQITTFSVANGIHSEPGYNVLRGSNLVGNLGWIDHPFHPAIAFFDSFYYIIGDGVVRTFLGNGPQADLFQINTSTGNDAAHPRAASLARIQEQSLEDDASLADLSPFEQHGGKLLLVHGVADSTIPTDASVLLYQRIVEAMGQQRAAAFVQLYLIPGYGHGTGVFHAGFDTVGILDHWSDEHLRPQNLVAIDQNKHAHRRERPMCPWPSWPRFTGKDPAIAASYTCTTNP